MLPVARADSIVSLGEGGTPLLSAISAFEPSTYWKDETRNPTGSMKDRALSVIFSKGKELGKTRAVIASTGSAGLAAAAYGARAHIAVTVLVPPGTPATRITAMAVFGARVLAVDREFEAITDVLARARNEFGWYEATTACALNPFQSAGPRTIAYEIDEQLGATPDAVLVPIGGGSTLGAIWRGFRDLVSFGRRARAPRMYGVQNVKFNALEVALREGLRTRQALEALGIDETRSTLTPNLKHAVPPDWDSALAAVRESGGDIVSVTDEQALAAQAELATTEGLFVEPSSAVVLPALRKLHGAGALRTCRTVVAILTGSGLRDVPLLAPTAGLAPRAVTISEALSILARG